MSVSDNVAFESDNESYLLSLGSILINDETKAVQLLNRIIEHLSSIGVSEKQIWKNALVYLLRLIKIKYTLLYWDH